jgi:hypothetical protein
MLIKKNSLIILKAVSSEKTKKSSAYVVNQFRTGFHRIGINFFDYKKSVSERC